MSGRVRSMIIVAAQYGALGLGCAMGFAQRIPCESLGGIALAAFFVEMLRYQWSPGLRQAHPNTALLCEALLLYACWICDGLLHIFTAPSLDFTGNTDFVINIHLLLPFLLAIGPLVRSKAWIGAAGAVAFFATVLAMLILNACSIRGGIGFFSGWVA